MDLSRAQYDSNPPRSVAISGRRKVGKLDEEKSDSPARTQTASGAFAAIGADLDANASAGEETAFEKPLLRSQRNLSHGRRLLPVRDGTIRLQIPMAHRTRARSIVSTSNRLAARSSARRAPRDRLPGYGSTGPQRHALAKRWRRAREPPTTSLSPFRRARRRSHEDSEYCRR